MSALTTAIEELKVSNEGLNNPKLVNVIDAMAAEVAKLKVKAAPVVAETKATAKKSQ